MGEAPPTFEELAVRQGIVTAAQVEECRRLREKFAADGVELALEEVLQKKGYLTKAQAMGVHAALGKGNKAVIEGYEILGKLGQGGMGAVYKARQSSMDRVVAIKVLLPKYAKDKDGVERFLREARAIAKLNHPNIVSGIDAGYSNGIYYFVMEFLDGETLAQRLARGGKLPWMEALGIVRQIGAALEHAHHHGLIHRDVKPANIILTREGGVKLADLGMARFQVQASTDITQTGQIMGTPLYMSPEQARGDELDIRTDLYALGINFYEMLAGRPPFTGDNPLAVLAKHLHETVVFSFPDVPPGVLHVGTRLTERERDRRYASPAELLRDLAALEEGKPIVPAKPAPVHAKTRRVPVIAPPRRKSNAPIVLGGIAAAALIAIAAILLVPGKEPPTPPAPSKKPAARVEEPKPLTDADRAALKAFEAVRAYEKGNADDFEEIALQYAALVPKTAGTPYADRARQGLEESRARLEMAIRDRKARIQEELLACRNDHAAETKALERHAGAFRNDEWKRWLTGQRSRVEAAVAAEERARREEEERKKAAAAAKTDPVAPKVEPDPAAVPTPEARLEPFLDRAEALAAKRQYEKIAAEAPKTDDPTLAKYLAAFRGAGEVPAVARDHAAKITGKPISFEIRGGAKGAGVVEAAQAAVVLIGGKTYDLNNATAASLAALYREARGPAAKAENVVHFALLDGEVALAEDLLKKNRVELLPRFERIVARAQREREAETLLKAAERGRKDEQQARLLEVVEKHPETRAAQAAKKRLEAFAREIVIYASESPPEAFRQGFEFRDSAESPGGKMLWVADGEFTTPPEEN